MSDNTILSVGSGGDVIATDDIGGVKYQRNKLIYGADGSSSGDVSTANPFPVHAYPITSGGFSILHVVTAATANAASVKASAGQLYGVYAFNAGSTAFYIKFHNTASTPSAGSGVVLALGCQAGLPVQYEFHSGIPFSTGIGITVVTDITNAGVTATALSQGVILVVYK